MHNYCQPPLRRPRHRVRLGVPGGFAAIETLDRSMQQCPSATVIMTETTRGRVAIMLIDESAARSAATQP